MSKIPVENSSKHGIFFNAQNKFRKSMVETSKEFNEGKGVSETLTSLPSKAGITLNGVKKQFTYGSLLPKMKEDIDEVTKQNPRILDLRLKLDQITKKQKGLINGLTQKFVEKERDESGPYSLLFDLQSSSTSCEEQECSDARIQKSSSDKLLEEFEYSCEAETNFPARRTFQTQSRSDLCLNFKSYTCPRPFEPNLSPNDNSLSRANEENSLDDSLGILTPDQMDDICYLENAFSPTVEGLPNFCDRNDSKGSSDTGDTPSTDKTESHSAASTIQNDGFGSCDNKVENDFSEASSVPPIDIQVVIKEDKNVLTTTINNKAILEIPHNSKEDCRQELIPNVMDEDFMPSINSSILDPASSVAETTVNLDLPLDCKLNDNSLTPQRIEQTPSPEDLPLDSCEIHTEISTCSNSQYSASILQDTQTFSDTKTDYTKSMETSKVSNSFITSITSITSLDGYQGDGEMSRPVSRSADHSIGAREEVIEMDWHKVPVTRRADPMTDSDFFTESDADGLDEQMQRGDRRAQVIDGALYGGKNGNGNPPLIVNRSEDSCMESSGVYTDFETHRTSPIFLNVIDDMSPEGSTLSNHSECSQKNVKSGEYIPSLDDTMVIKGKYCKADDEETLKNTSKRNSINSVKDAKVNDKSPKEEKRFLKKYNMPKRDVPSKLKIMLDSGKNGNDSSLQGSPKTVNRKERCDNKINAIKNVIKQKSYKDVKSKVDCSFPLQRSCSVTRVLSPNCPNNNTKPKSRHTRMRLSGSVACSGKSSLHSSQSDISASSTPIAKSSNRFTPIRYGKKRESLPTPTATARTPAASTQPPAPVTAKKNGVVQKLAASPVTVRARTSLAPPPSPRRTTPRRPIPQRPTTLPTNNKGVALQKKWKGIRDVFVRELKKVKNVPSGSGAYTGSYVYFQRLMFLQATVRNKKTESNINTVPDEDESNCEDMMRPPSQTRKRKKISAADEEFLQIVQKSLVSQNRPEPQTSPAIEHDDDKLFCLSLHKELLKVPEANRIAIKIKLMEVLQKAQQTPESYHSSSASFPMSAGYVGQQFATTNRQIDREHSEDPYGDLRPTVPSLTPMRPRYAGQRLPRPKTPGSEYSEDSFDDLQYNPKQPSSTPMRSQYTGRRLQRTKTLGGEHFEDPFDDLQFNLTVPSLTPMGSQYAGQQLQTKKTLDSQHSEDSIDDLQNNTTVPSSTPMRSQYAGKQLQRTKTLRNEHFEDTIDDLQYNPTALLSTPMRSYAGRRLQKTKTFGTEHSEDPIDDSQYNPTAPSLTPMRSQYARQQLQRTDMFVSERSEDRIDVSQATSINTTSTSHAQCCHPPISATTPSPTSRDSQESECLQIYGKK